MILSRRLPIGKVGFFGGGVVPDQNLGSVYAYSGSKPAAPDGHPLRETPACPSGLILSVLGKRRLTQIIKSIVRAVTIAMIYPGWVSIREHFPDDAMRLEQRLSDRNPEISRRWSLVAGFLGGISAVPSRRCAYIWEMRDRPYSPSENTSCWVIVQALAQVLSGWQYLGSHWFLRQGAKGQGGVSPARLASPASYIAVST